MSRGTRLNPWVSFNLISLSKYIMYFLKSLTNSDTWSTEIMNLKAQQVRKHQISDL